MKAVKVGRRTVFVLGLCLWSACANALIVIGSCSVSATSVVFDVYDPASPTPRDGTGTVTITCNIVLGLLESWDIALNAGNGGGFAPRRLLSGPNALNYNLYTNAARTTVWGDGSGGTVKAYGASTLSVGAHSVNYTVYGRIPAYQDRPAGNYGDLITVTLNY